MRGPMHSILIQTDCAKQIAGKVQAELTAIPHELEQLISERNRFVFRLILEEFVVGLLQEMKEYTTDRENQNAHCYQLEIVLAPDRGLICFNGDQKVVRFDMQSSF